MSTEPSWKPEYNSKKLYAWLRLVDAFNALEDLGQDMAPDTEPFSSLAHIFIKGDYAVAWNSETNRWELVSETDYAPEVN